MANSIPHVANVTRETSDVSVHGNKAKSNGGNFASIEEALGMHDYPFPSQPSRVSADLSTKPIKKPTG
jgi:hypothetical protein